MFFTEEFVSLSVSSGMNIKVTYNFYLSGQKSPGIVNLYYEANGMMAKEVIIKLCYEAKGM